MRLPSDAHGYGPLVTMVLGLALIALGVVAAVLQVGWVARSTPGPVQRWRVSAPLPRMQRHASDLAIAALLIAGAIVVEQGRPWWTFYAAVIVGSAVAAVAQALAVRALPARVGH
ncbi:hypothetical protein SAMN06272739_3755 [Blastococcus haudaquaticus]|uniref:Uncharacterized protein n=1 Tax=Blastococcus haudaquaticus TaxID=1938745 RepID=A0A286H5R2_9ACTN|nr:hypothetical protein SAMN06272739_3755 [Blastococcus haudaquaticus]